MKQWAGLMCCMLCRPPFSEMVTNHKSLTSLGDFCAGFQRGPCQGSANFSAPNVIGTKYFYLPANVSLHSLVGDSWHRGA